jgi:triacylglycerol lipase
MNTVSHLLLAKCSEAAYEGTKAFYQLGFDVVDVMCSNSTKCAVYLATSFDKELNILAFRGTDDKMDVLDDIKRFRINTKQGWFIHRGFWNRWDWIRPRVDNMIARAPNMPILAVTGHSLGGALATLAVANPSSLEGLCCPRKGALLVTFGQPRVGGKVLASVLDGIGAIRYVNQGDLIVKLPTLGYRHGGVYLALPSGLVDDYSAWNIIRNHSIREYIRRLGNLGQH